jgi:hypothetical protein
MSVSGRDRVRVSGGYDSIGLSPEASGHTVGLAASSDGVFHAVWVDNRSGISQLWTAPITVTGSAIRNGSPELSALQDVSSKTQVGFANASFQWSSGELSFDMYVKNTSKKALRGPLKLRLTRVSSLIGEVKGVQVGDLDVAAGTVLQVSADGLAAGHWSKQFHVVARIAPSLDFHSDQAPNALNQMLIFQSKRYAPKGK